MNESYIEKKLKNGVERRGGVCLKLTSPGRSGMPDRLLLLPGGIAIFVELKTDTGKVSPLQRYWLNKFRDLGFQAEVLYGIDAVEGFLRGI